MERLTCQDVLSILFEYLDNEIAEEMVERIEVHRLSCPHCTKVIRSFRLVFAYLKETEEKEVPVDIHEELLALVRTGISRNLQKKRRRR